jgi:cell division protein FtsQ
VRLTPAYRLITRRVLPLALSAAVIGGWVSVPENRAAFSLMLADIRAQIEARPEFQVNLMAIDGASPALSEAIRAALAIELPASSLDLDFAWMEEAITALDPVASVSLRLRQGGVLQIDVAERQPALLWRGADTLMLLDATGTRAGIARARHLYPDLPVIAGEGARDAVPEALTLFAAMGPLAPRLRGLERMGKRRWDVVLDRGQRILLPETGAAQALERAVAMVEAEHVLAASVAALDLRLPRRPTVRLRAEAAERRWDIGLHRPETGDQSP